MRRPLSFISSISLSALCAALAACAAPMTPPYPSSSTQGTTLVETGEIIAAAPLASHGGALPTQPSSVSAAPTLLTIRFTTGEIRSYTAQADAGFEVGDRVSVSSNRGTTRISRR